MLNRSRLFPLLFLVLILALPAPRAFAADRSGSHDHALFPRFAGSEIIGYKTTDYDAYTFALGKVYEADNWKKVLKKSQTVEGKVTRILYLAPQGKTTLQVQRNYQQTFDRLGFEPLYSCEGQGGCGYGSWFVGAQTLGGLRNYAMQIGDDFRYLATRLTRKQGDVYVSLLVYKFDSVAIGEWKYRTMAELNVVEIAPMKQEMVKAEDLKQDIRNQGHASITQILFASDKAEIQPASKPVLDEIAKLLKKNPELKVIFVGHTDSQGDLQYNMKLSSARAKAVRDAIRDDYGIAAERLGAAGLGYLAPVASNRTEAGRAQNRRVEIIEQ